MAGLEHELILAGAVDAHALGGDGFVLAVVGPAALGSVRGIAGHAPDVVAGGGVGRVPAAHQLGGMAHPLLVDGDGLAVGNDGPHGLVSLVVAQIKAQHQRR